MKVLLIPLLTAGAALLGVSNLAGVRPSIRMLVVVLLLGLALAALPGFFDWPRQRR